jgi:alkylhydroperoxidase/carboxymuconolactone decarboxylase family protein YurZ
MGFLNIAIILRILLGFFQVFYAISRDLLGFSKILGFFQRFFGMDGQEESAAKQKAFENVLPELQKEFADVYVDNLRWMKALKNDPDILCIERLWKRRRHLRTKTRLILMKLYLQRLTKESFC